MPIPKGLIIYKASRYRSPLPTNIKYGYYSNKAISTPCSRGGTTDLEVYFYRYQKKFVTGIEVQFDEEEDDEEEYYDGDSSLREHEAVQIFSAFKNVKKCKISFYSPQRTKMFRRIFKELKRIQNLVLSVSTDFFKSSKFFKNLLLAKSLESLTLHSFDYSANHNDLQHLMRTIKLASKRRCWPNFKSLNIDFSIEDIYEDSPPQTLERLLECMQDLESCEDIYKCSSFKLTLPKIKTLNSEQRQVLNEIAEIVPSLTKIKILHFDYLPEILNIFKTSKNFKEFSIFPTNKNQQKLDLSPLNEMSTFQELTIENSARDFAAFYINFDFLAQIHTFVNLKSLCIHYWGIGNLKEELKFDISNLSQLQSFELELHCQVDPKKWRASNRIWVKEIFQAIGKKQKLEKLSLLFDQVSCNDFGGLLLILGRSLKKQTQLLYLELFILEPHSIEADKIIAFCKSLKKLNRLQELDIQVLQGCDFGQEDFNLLIRCIEKSFPLLSNLALGFGEFNLSLHSCHLLLKMIHRTKSLNSFTLLISSSDLDLEVLLETIRKKIRVSIIFI